MKRLIRLATVATVIAQCSAATALGQNITKKDVCEAVAKQYAIVDALVEESHLTAAGKRSEGTSYRLKCFDILSRGDSMIVTEWTRDYEKEPVLKRRRYILILTPRTHWRAQELDFAGRRRNEILQWIKEVKAEK